MSTMPQIVGEVILGVDTHEREHVAALIDELGRLLATRSFPATIRGFKMLIAWARGRGDVRYAGVEGTGSFGAGLARFLADQGVQVVEVTRPNRRGRRHLGKSDTVDAEAAARMVLSGEATATPKRRDGIVESIRVLQIARRSAIKARTQAGQQIRSLVVTAPAELNSALAGLTVARQVDRCARIRPRGDRGAVASTQRALRSLARRWQQLDREVDELERELHALVRAAAPRSKPPAARPAATGSTKAATGKATTLSGRSRTTVSSTTQRRAPTPPGAPPKDAHAKRSSAASNAISPAASTGSSSPTSHAAATST